jgi:hypothetical protein
VKAKPVKRLFKPGGLKLIFALLNNPGMEKATNRDMAKTAIVALGTVDFVLTELKELGFLIDMGKKGRQMHQIWFSSSETISMQATWKDFLKKRRTLSI